MEIRQMKIKYSHVVRRCYIIAISFHEMPFDACNKPLILKPTIQNVYSTYICCHNVIRLLGICIYWWCVCYISGRWVLHIWTTVSYLDDKGYISVRLWHIWTIEVTYPYDCYITGRWRLHTWMTVTYLDVGGYISRWLLHIWTMEVTYLDDCYQLLCCESGTRQCQW